MFVLSGAGHDVKLQIEERQKLLTGQITGIIEREFLDEWASVVTTFRNEKGLSNLSPEDRQFYASFYLQSRKDILALRIYDPDGNEILEWLSPDIAIKERTREYSESIKVLLNLDSSVREELLASGRNDIQLDFVAPATLYMEPKLELLAIPTGGGYRMQDRRIGAITCIVSLNRLVREMNSLAKANNVDILLLDETGTLLLHSDPVKNFSYPKPKFENVPSVKEFMGPILRWRHGDIRNSVHVVTRGHGDEFTLEGFKCIGDNWNVGPWVLWTKLKDTKQLSRMLSGHAAVIHQWTLLGILLSGVGGALFFVGISKPISSLLSAGRRLAGGDFSTKVEINSNNEFGELADILNDIEQTLQKNRDTTLDRIVSDKHRTEAIVKSMADGLLVIDGDSRIAMMNSTFEEWFGLFEMSAVGKPYRNIIENENLKRHIEEIESSGRKGVFSTEIQIVTPGNRMTKSLQVQSVCTVDFHDRRAGVVLVLRDITREKKIDQMKSDLVSTVSHELRTPITSIQGFSEILLEDEPDAEERREFLEIIHMEAKRLGALISDFLDLSRIESGEITMKMKSLNLREILDASLMVVESQAEERNVTIHLDFPDQAVYMIGDRDKLEQVFINLFSNGIKYGRERSDLFIRVIVEDESIEILVKDTGSGIPEEALKHIFNKFYRVDMSSTAKMRGTGLGLAIVKEIVERHGGNVHVESKVGVGSVFSVRLPRYGN